VLRTLSPRYTMASGWTIGTELHLLATIVTRALSARHDARGNAGISCIVE